MSEFHQGERGPQGDSGQTGQPGAQGVAGRAGQGERGQMGDKGKEGATGERGQTGQQGIAGLIGRDGIIGERGPTGDHGQPGEDAPPVFSKIQVLVLFLFVVLAFSVLAFRSEVNANKIESQSRIACERANTNTEAINSFLDLIIENVKISKQLTPAEIKQRVAGYEGQKINPIECKS